MINNAKILIAEDDGDISNLIRSILEQRGYRSRQAFSGTEAALLLRMESYDMMILDLMLPGMSGEALLQTLRGELHSRIPVLVLSAKSSLGDKVGLLTAGADDYMTKPFEPEELAARVLACLRRGGAARDVGPDCFTYKNLQLFPQSRKAVVGECEIVLTPHEFDILAVLVKEPEKVFSRETLYEKVWQGGYYGEDNTVNVHVSNLRKKIAALDENNEYIKTVWGIGFKMA